MNNDVSDIAKLLGKRGGDTTKKRFGRKHFSEAGKIGMAKRWGKKTKTTASARGTTKTK